MRATPLRPAEAAAVRRFMGPVDLGPFRFHRRSQSLVRSHELGWRHWLHEHFAETTRAGFAPRHERLWEFFDGLTPGIKPPAEVESWPRGGAKSTTAELGVTYVGQKGTRRFALYVSMTQGQANKHTSAIGTYFGRCGAERALDRYGNSLGWRIDLLRVAGGFNVLGLGLDAAARGIKLDDFRPDLLIFDDFDDRHDNEKAVERKIVTITETILPMGAPDAAVLFIQNRVHRGSIMSRLIDGQAEFLNDRQVFEEPALEGLEYEGEVLENGRRHYTITAGVPTWAGQDRDLCETQMNEWGRPAFLREAQHDTTEVEGGLWDRERDIDPFRIPPPGPDGRAFHLGELVRIAVAIDPNAKGSDPKSSDPKRRKADDAGIMVGGIFARLENVVDRKGRQVRRRVMHGVLLEDATVPGGPKKWAQAAVAAVKRWKAHTLVAEDNNGGEMVEITIATVPGAPRVKRITASRGKQTRAEPVQKLCEDGLVHHLQPWTALEVELCTWQPGMASPNRLDAYVWLWTELLVPLQGQRFEAGFIGMKRREPDAEQEAA